MNKKKLNKIKFFKKDQKEIKGLGLKVAGASEERRTQTKRKLNEITQTHVQDDTSEVTKSQGTARHTEEGHHQHPRHHQPSATKTKSKMKQLNTSEQSKKDLMLKGTTRRTKIQNETSVL